ncbi:hypothetical protein AB0M46_12200 [Dactylosporangium sp. NPDC051485]
MPAETARQAQEWWAYQHLAPQPGPDGAVDWVAWRRRIADWKDRGEQ